MACDVSPVWQLVGGTGGKLAAGLAIAHSDSSTTACKKKKKEKRKTTSSLVVYLGLSISLKDFFFFRF